jgi:hypothetical protein
MKSKMFLLLGIIMLSMLMGCGSNAWYHIELHEVERPALAKERYGEQKIITTQEEGEDKYVFEDEMVKILWLPEPDAIHFHLTNKTTHSIKIIWDEAAYVDVNGNSRRVMHSGVKYIDRTNPQPPTTVVRNGSIKDLIFPTDNVYFSGDRWVKKPLFPHAGFTATGLSSEVEPYRNKSFQVLLPLQIEDVVNDYIFVFNIKDIQVK